MVVIVIVILRLVLLSWRVKYLSLLIRNTKVTGIIKIYLIIDVLDCISRARVNKIYVMQSLFRNFDVDDLMFPQGQEPLSEFKKSVDIFKVPTLLINTSIVKYFYSKFWKMFVFMHSSLYVC